MGIMNRLYSFDPLIKQADESIGRPGPIDDYWYGDAGGASQTGVSVTPDTAMRASAVQACVRVLAETVAQLPLKVYETQPDGGKAEARNHPIFSLLHDQPNAWQTSFEFRETLQGHLALRGNAYAELIPGARGFVDQLIPLNPDKVNVEQLPNKRLIYTVYEDRRARKLTQDEVLHIRGLSSDGIMGLSPIKMSKDAIGLALATEAYGARFFSNDARPGGVLQHPGHLGDEAIRNLQNSWMRAHSGVSNSSKPAVLEEGMKWEQIGMTSEDAQFIETRKYQVNEIARIFRIPPHLIGDLEKATFCLPGDAEVMTVNGPVDIKDVKRGDIVWSRDESNIAVKAKVLQNICNGFDDILKIKTTNRTLRANGNHRILAMVEKLTPAIKGQRGGKNVNGKKYNVKFVPEYIPTKELKVGDAIVVMDKLQGATGEESPTRRVSIGFMEFLGLYIGDGCMDKGAVKIARASNSTYMERYRNEITNNFVKYDGGNGRGDATAVELKEVVLQEYDRETKFSSILAVAELKALGFGGNAHNKKIPGWIYKLSDELKLGFLRGYLDADGSVDKKGRVSFSSCNKKLLSGMRHLLMSLGIPVTNFTHNTGMTTLPNKKKAKVNQWSITCSDPEQNKRIGSHTPQYIERMNSGKPFNKKGRNYPRFGGKYFKSENFKLSRIRSIKPDGREKVYDLEVEGTHSFIADGVVVHNSNIEQQSLEFVIHTMMPWLVRWEQALNKDLILNKQRFFIKFNVDGLLRGDITSRYTAYNSAITTGWMTRNEARAKEDMNPLPGLDQPLEQLNMTPTQDRQPQESEAGSNGHKHFAGVIDGL